MHKQQVPEELAARGRRAAIAAQCFGAIGLVLFSNNFMLSYFKRLGMSSSHVLMLFAVPHIMALFLRMPMAFVADRFGKKKLGFAGLAVSLAGFSVFLIAGAAPEASVYLMLTGGILLFGLGSNITGASWFSLLSPIVPANMRGRFFSTLRISWQSVSVVFTLVSSMILSRVNAVRVYQAVLAAALVMMAVRIIFYRRIPEVENTERERKPFLRSLMYVVRLPGFMPFSAYIFLINLCTGSTVWLFGLLQREALEFSEGLVIKLGMAVLVGNIFGYYIGGKGVDRYGNRSVFLVCHLGFAAILTGVIGRVYLPGPAVLYITLLCMLFGVLHAAVGIATSSEMFALLPQENKSLATSFVLTMVSLGTALAGILPARMIDWGVLSENWTLHGRTLTQYDTLLIGQGIMVLMFTVTLGLVPSVIKQARWLPRSG